jgi:hypothetical protein
MYSNLMRKRKDRTKRSKNMLAWLWDHVLADRVPRAELNPTIKGMILTGDLNQKYDDKVNT